MKHIFQLVTGSRKEIKQEDEVDIGESDCQTGWSGRPLLRSSIQKAGKKQPAMQRPAVRSWAFSCPQRALALLSLTPQRHQDGLSHLNCLLGPECQKNNQAYSSQAFLCQSLPLALVHTLWNHRHPAHCSTAPQIHRHTQPVLSKGEDLHRET